MGALHGYRSASEGCLHGVLQHAVLSALCRALLGIASAVAAQMYAAWVAQGALTALLSIDIMCAALTAREAWCGSRFAWPRSASRELHQ